MATDTLNRINAARQAGLSDVEILQGMKESPRYKQSFIKSRAAGLSDADIARDLGLNITASTTKAKSVEPKHKQEAPSALVRFGAGMNDIYAGAKQGVLYAKDKLTGSNDYDKFTAEQKEANALYEKGRADNGMTGIDGMRLLGGMVATAPAGAAVKGLQGAKLATAAGAKFLGRNAAVGAGIGGVGFAEDAGQRVKNTGFGAVGGAAGGAAGHGIGKLTVGAKRAINPPDMQGTQAEIAANIDATVNLALKDAGTTIADLRPAAQQALRDAVKKAMQGGKSPDADALKRSAVFANLKAEGFDLKPTLKQATGNPKIWQQETELSKLAGSEKLTTKYVDDHSNLARMLDDAQVRTGGTAADKHQAGEVLLNSLSKQDAARRDYISTLYDQAKNHAGNDLTLDAGRFSNNLQQTLNESLLDIDNLPPVLLKRLDGYTNGGKPFTLTEKENLVKAVNNALGEMKGPATAEQRALMSFRKALEAEVDDALDGFGTQLQGEAKASWEAARQAAAGRFGVIKRTPALKAALDDVAPDKAFDKLVMRSNIRDLEAMKSELTSDPATLAALKQQMIKHISDKAMNANNEFSPRAMSNALKSIGDRRLAVLFEPKEIAHLKDIEAAGRYLITQPNQSNVNNSNTSAALMNYFGFIANLPGVKQAVDRFVLPTGRAMGADASLSGGSASKAIVKTATLDAPKPLSGAEKELIGHLERMGMVVTPNMFRRQSLLRQEKPE